MGSDRGLIVADKLLGLSADEGAVFLESKEATGSVQGIINNIKVFDFDGASLVLRNFAGYAGASPRISTRAVTTEDATATNIWSLSVPLSGIVGVAALVTGKRVGTTADGVVAFLYNAATNAAGTVAVVGTTGGSTLENSSGTPAVTLVANDTADTIELKVAGIAAQTYSWTALILHSSLVSSS